MMCDELDVVTGSFGYIIGKTSIYETVDSASPIEVDFLQGVWCLKTSWLKELLIGMATAGTATPGVAISSLLWTRLRVRSVAVTIDKEARNALLNSFVPVSLQDAKYLSRFVLYSAVYISQSINRSSKILFI